MSEQQPKDKQAEAEAKARAAAQEAEAKRRAAEQQHQGAGPQSTVGASTVNLGLFGNFAPPQYQPSIAQMKALPPVEPLHGPGAAHAVAVVVPADFERFNPKLALGQLRSVIEPAQVAAINAACAAKDFPRARQLLREVFGSLAARINAAGDAVALGHLKEAGRAANTLDAAKLYFAAAQCLRRPSMANRATAMPSSAPVTAASRVAKANLPAESSMEFTPAPRFDQQMPMVLPPSILVPRQSAAPQPARALQVDPVRDAVADARADGKAQASAARFAEVHRTSIAQAVIAMVADNRHGWPQPAAMIEWQNEAQFSNALGGMLYGQVLAQDIAGLVAPYSLASVYVQHVPPTLPLSATAPAFCGAVALLLQRVVHASVLRVGARVASLVADGVTPRAGGVVTSHPVDSSVVAAMMQAGVLDTHRVKPSAGATASVAGVASLRTVTVHWLGRKDPTLWNYVRVEPADASREEVAVAIAGGNRKASAQAFQITAHGDRFQVAPALARAAIAAHFAGEVVGAARDDAYAAQTGAALAASPESDGAALAQAGEFGTPQAAQAGKGKQRGQAVTLQGVLNVQRDIGVQLQAIHAALEPLALASLLAPAEAFRARNVSELADGDVQVWTRWLPVLNAQHLILIDIARRVVPAARQALTFDIAARVTGQPTANAQALKALVKIFARAAGASHIPASSQQILGELAQAQYNDVLDQIDRSQLDLQKATRAGADRSQAAATRDAQAKLDTARTHALQGDADGHEVGEAQIAARETALRRRMTAAEQGLAKLLAKVEAKRGILSMPEFFQFPIAIEAAQIRLHRIEGIWKEHTRLNGTSGDALVNWQKWQAREAGVAAAEQAFAQVGGDESLAGLLRRGANLVDHQYREIAESCLKLGLILLVTVVTGGLAAELAGMAELGMLARAQRVLAYAGEVAGVSGETTAMVAGTIARGVGMGTGLTVEAAAGASAQVVTQGGDAKRAFIDNLIMGGFNRLFAGPMSALHATEAECAAMSRFGRAKVFITGITVEALAGMMQGEMTRLTTAAMGMQNAAGGGFSDELLQQGAGIALGKYFHRIRGRWAKHAADIEAVYREEAEWMQLKAAREAFFAEADALAANLSPNPAAGAALVAKNTALSEQELALKRKLDVQPGKGVVRVPSASVEHVAQAGNREHAAGEHVSTADHRPRVQAADLPTLAKKLGVAVEFATEGRLVNAVEVHYLTLANGNIAPTKIIIGTEALHADVMLHKRTLKSMQRYNGVVGELRLVWDRLTKANGAVNRFPKGSRAWELFEEVSKIDELVRSRLTARMRSGVVAPEVLAAEVSYLQAKRKEYAQLLHNPEALTKQAGTGHVDKPELYQIALGDGPESGAVRRVDKAQHAGVRVPKEKMSVAEILAEPPGTTTEMYAKGWEQRSDAAQLLAHGRALDLHEANFRRALEQHAKTTREQRAGLASDVASAKRELEAYQASKASSGHDKNLPADEKLVQLQAKLKERTEQLAKLDSVEGSYKAKLTEAEGERAATSWMLEHEPGAVLVRGFEAGTGFDQVWVRKDKNGKVVEYIIVEGKGHGAELSKGNDKGDQMSDMWVTESALELRRKGNVLGRDILAALKGESGAVVTGRVIQADGAAGANNTYLPDAGDGTYKFVPKPVEDK